MQVYDVVIIGAGPAGLSAAIQCRENYLNVIVLDEFPKAGGRLLGQLHQEPNGEWWNGIKEGNTLKEKAEKLDTNIQLGVSVHHIEKTDNQQFVVHTNKQYYHTKYVIIATGAAESPIPVPGWTLPGVMSIGAAQVMTNVHRVKVGNNGVIIGINVLSAAIARELQLAGINVKAMALPVRHAVSREQAIPREVLNNMSRFAHMAPSKFIQLGSKFAKYTWAQNLALQFWPKNGMKIWDIPIHLRKAIKQINGTDKVESVTMVDVTVDGEIIENSEQEIPVDFVCIASGLYPLAELAAVVGVPFIYSEELGGHVPIHNETMETPIPGIYVAGNITGIESAKVAREQGTVAGLSIVLKETDRPEEIRKKLTDAVKKVKVTRENATIQFHPHIEQGRKKVEARFEEVVKEKKEVIENVKEKPHKI